MTSSTKSLRLAASTLLLLLIWQGTSLLVGRPLLLPSPLQVFGVFGYIFLRADFWPSIGATLTRFALGFGIALLAALLLGGLAGKFPMMEDLLAPAIQLVRAVPTVAIVLLVLVWLKSERTPILVAVLMAFPVLYFNVIEGVRAVDGKLLDMVRLYRVPPLKVLTKLYLPSLAPYLSAGILSATGIALKMTIAAEVFSQPEVGIGVRFQMARMSLDVPALFGWALWVVVLSSLIDGGLKIGFKKIGFGAS